MIPLGVRIFGDAEEGFHAGEPVGADHPAHAAALPGHETSITHRLDADHLAPVSGPRFQGEFVLRGEAQGGAGAGARQQQQARED